MFWGLYWKRALSLWGDTEQGQGVLCAAAAQGVVVPLSWMQNQFCFPLCNLLFSGTSGEEKEDSTTLKICVKPGTWFSQKYFFPPVTGTGLFESEHRSDLFLWLPAALLSVTKIQYETCDKAIYWSDKKLLIIP